MTLAHYLFNDDDEGFIRECERLFGKKKSSSDEETNLNKENNRFSRSAIISDDLEL